MADININEQVSFERESYFEAFRDKVEELDIHLPDIDSIENLEKEEIDENTVKVVNHWKANGNQLPKALRSFIKPDMLSWKEYATYDKDKWEAQFSIEAESLKEAINCEGKILFEDKGNNETEVTIDAQLKIDASKIPGVPKLGSGKISKTFEDFAVPMISSNLSEYVKAVKSYLESQ